jgi:hypothetical protein
MKKYLLGIVALSLAIGFSAFKSHPVAPKKYTTFWFSFVGTPGTSDVSNQLKYDPISGDPGSTVCPSGTLECALAVSAEQQDANHVQRPNLTNVTYDGNGNPQAGGAFVANRTKF